MNEIFEVWWSHLDSKLKSIPKPELAKEAKKPQRSDREILEEVLGVVRGLERAQQQENVKVQTERPFKRLSDIYDIFPYNKKEALDDPLLNVLLGMDSNTRNMLLANLNKRRQKSKAETNALEGSKQQDKEKDQSK